MNTTRLARMRRRVPFTTRARKGVGARGFTLVELMVALTGGLFVSMVVFALARDGSRFYQRESRVAEATLGTLIGFERLRDDIARAGFLSTPNVQRDATFCGDPNVQIPASHPQLRSLASLQITAAEADVSGNKVLKSATPAITPHSILLAGAYSSVDKFDIWETVGPPYQIRLQSARGALARMNWANLDMTARLALLVRLFPKDRALRIYSNDTGTFQLGVIDKTEVIDNSPVISLDNDSKLLLRGSGATRCNASVNQQVNVINFIRYTLRDLSKANPADYAGYSTLQSDSALKIPGEDTRLELVREEVTAKGVVVPETREVIAEYGVDLRFALTTVDNPLAATPAFITTPFNSADVLEIAGTVVGAPPKTRPQNVRSIRTRLSIRSREADRDADVDTSAGDVAPGLYRIGLSDDGKSQFARVRTLQADIFLSSHAEVRW